MSLRPVFAFVFLLGLMLLAYSWPLPIYTDANAKYTLDGQAASWSKEKREKDYYPAVAGLRTAKVPLMDWGTGLAIAAGCVWVLLLATGVRRVADLSRLHSPNRSTLWLAANLVWLLRFPGTAWYYTFRQQRGDYPWFADSIGLGIAFEQGANLLLMIPMNVFILLALWKGDWPTPLFVRPANYTRSVRVEEAFWLFWLIFNQVVLVDYVRFGEHVDITVNLFFTYILLSLRAGRMQRYGVAIAG